MWKWISENSELLQVGTAVVTALVWMIYLQIIAAGLRRQRRSEILIHMGGARDLSGRILVSNLGLEAIYVLEIILTVWTAEGERMSSVADRTEIAKDEHATSREATLQGPLKTGDSVDIGSATNLLDRARHRSLSDLKPQDIQELEITVAAITAADSQIAAASRRFLVRQEEDGLLLAPRTLHATQIRSRLRRRQMEARLKSML